MDQTPSLEAGAAQCGVVWPRQRASHAPAFWKSLGSVAAFGPFLLGLGAISFPVSNYYLQRLPAFEIFPALFLAAPLFDVVIGQDKQNRVQQASYRTARFTRYDVLLWVWGLTLPILQMWTLLVIAPGDLRGIDAFSLMASVGLISAVFGIPVAHELIHRRSRLERGLAELLMCSMSYPFWCFGHVYGHHRLVATADDPATARLNEPYYRFLCRAFISELRLVYVLERDRMARLGLGPFARQSRLLRYAIELALLYGAVGLAFGLVGIGFLVLLAAMGVALLHLMNYVQHYGLVRREITPGVIEGIGPHHSWNTTSRYSNASLLNLGRHSDHHLASERPFHCLRHLDETRSPHLPFGVPVQFLMALIPPLWFWYMNPRVYALRTSAENQSPRLDGTLDDLRNLSALIAHGAVRVEPAQIDVATRRTVLADKINQFGLWLFAAAVIAFVVAYNLGGILGAYGTLITLACISAISRRLLARQCSDQRIVAWALDQPWNWPMLWRDSQIRLLQANGTTIAQSPTNDWVSGLRAASARLEV